MQKDRLRRIFSKTNGHCHLCHKKLCFTNFGIIGARGNWNVEHSVAKANGGSDHVNNLLPACVLYNTEKRTDHTITVRLR